MKATYDAVVIGSGFGGAVFACRLAQAGLDVAILERGRRYPAGAFPRDTTDLDSGRLWTRGQSLFDVRNGALRPQPISLRSPHSQSLISRLPLVKGCSSCAGSRRARSARAWSTST